jgi:hypothetical protein
MEDSASTEGYLRISSYEQSTGVFFQLGNCARGGRCRTIINQHVMRCYVRPRTSAILWNDVAGKNGLRVIETVG